MQLRCWFLVAWAITAACDRPETQPAGQAATPAPALIPGTPEGDLADWVRAIVEGTEPLPGEAKTDGGAAQRKALDLYVTRQEYIEMYYGPGGKLNASAELGTAIEAAESRFHELMKLLGATPVDVPAVQNATDALREQELRVLSIWRAGNTRLQRGAAAAGTAVVSGSVQQVDAAALRTTEIREVVTAFNNASAAYRDGDAARARTLLLAGYLEGFEPIESRLPAGITNKVEHLIHVQIRPAIERGADKNEVANLINAANAQLVAADQHLARGGGSFWFTAVNSFVIIVREGLEAVLLVGALLGYLAATGASRRHRRQIFAGVGAGIVASFMTWGAARTLIPINGANRELIEGLTALVAVGVLLYVSNWLFQKTYIHDWKNYLRSKLNTAVSSKSAFAMMLLAFAAVYREGFETVLFYQALIFDASAGAVVSGFIPGMLLILAVGVLIIKAGAKLPLKQLFTVTNSVLVYLAFVFVGKGLYNLHEAGVFAARQLPLPDVQALRLLFGWYPLLETTVAQALYLTLIATTFLFYKRRLALRAAAG